MTIAVSRRDGVDPGVIRVQERRRSGAAGLHGQRLRGNRRAIELSAIEESIAAWGDEDDE